MNMNTTFTFTPATMAATFADLSETCNACAEKRVPNAVANICTLIANMIAASGPNGGMAQGMMMDQASAAGFSPEYYAGGIRVSYLPKADVIAGIPQGKAASKKARG